MLFFKENQHEAKQVEAIEIPNVFHHLLIPHSTKYFTSGDFGLIISQEIRETNYAIWEHHFFIDRECTLIAYNDSPMLTINFMLQGNPYTSLPSVNEDILKEGFYRLFYVPAVEQPVSFVAGQFHCAHICFNTNMLREKTRRHERLTLLLDYAIQDGKTIVPYLAGSIDLITKMQVMDLLWYPDSKGDRSIYTQQLAGKLLLQYIRRHHSMKDDMVIIEEYIARKLDKSLNIPQLAKYCCKSESELYRIFKLQYATSPYQYFQKKRMEKIRKLLLTTNMTTAQIVESMGFDSMSGFFKFFKKHFKTTPEEYRKNMNK